MLLQSLNRLRGLLAHARNDREDRRLSRRNTWRHRTVNSTPEQLEQREVLSVTTAYDFVDVQNIDLTQGSAASQPAATRLISGGMAVSATGGGNTDLDIFNSNLTDGGGANDLTGTNSAIAQLSNGHLVIASQDADSIRYAIRTSTGALVVGTTDIGDMDSSEPDVAAASGSFWIVNQDTNGSTNWDIDIRRYNNAGVLLGGSTIGSTSSGKDARPSIAVLDNGNVAVAWHRNRFLGNEVWLAVLSSTGATVKAPTMIDDVGISNRDVDITSTPAGFAIVYMDSEWDTETEDITMKRFTGAGVLLGTTNLSDPSGSGNDFGHEAKPTITRLANNLLVAGWEDNRQTQPGTNLTDTFVHLFDPATGARLTTIGRNVTAGEAETDDVGEIAIAGSANGRINVLHTNITDNDVDGESFAGQRTSTSNDAGDSITGDDFVDIMHGNGGNDTLQGGGNNDVLNGGAGADTLNGGLGQDVLNGGSQADQFVFALVTHSPAGLSRDSITDFSKAQSDKINVAPIDGMAGTAGTNPFTQFIGSNAFTAEGQIRAIQSGSDTIVQFNTTGTSVAEMEVLLVNFTASTLALSDFLVAPAAASLASTTTGSGSAQRTGKAAGRLPAGASLSSNVVVLTGLGVTQQASQKSSPANQPAVAITTAGSAAPKKHMPRAQSGSTSLTESNLQNPGSFSQLNTLDSTFADISTLLLPLG